MGKITFSDVEKVTFNLIDLNGDAKEYTGQVRNYELQKKLQALHFNIEKMSKAWEDSKDLEEKQTISEDILEMKHRIMSVIFNEDKEVFKKYSADMIDAVIKAYGEFYSKKFEPKEEIKN